MYFFVIIVSILLICVLWSLIEQKLIMTTKYYITTSKPGKEFEAMSFILLADLHNHAFGKNNIRLLHKIEELAPDYIIIAGDLITKNKKCIPSNAFSLLEKLVKKYKIYYAHGNHEQYMANLGTEQISSEQIEKQELYSTWVEYIKMLSDLGVIFLDNKSSSLSKNGNNICISGINIDKVYFEHHDSTMPKDYIENLLGKREDASYQILIAHNPIYFKNYVNWGADLILSGHFHGGLIRLPFLGGVLSPQVKFFPKYDAGRFKENDSEMIISKGLGSHSLMFRLFNPPELVYIKFKK